MPTQYVGKVATVYTQIPTAKSISSTTNATPIVVTTSTSHGLQTGEVFRVTGATDAAANGVWIAGTVTSNTVVLLVFPTGANSVGTGGGGAAGTLLSAGFGYTVPVPASGDPYSYNTFLPAFAAILDEVAFLRYMAQFAVILRAEGSMYVEDGASLSGVWDFGSADVLGLAPRLVDITPTLLTDVDHTIGISGGRRYRVTGSPALLRTISIAKTGADAPRTGETIEILVRDALATGHSYTIKRSGSANDICQFWGADNGDVGVWARFIFDIDNEWHLDLNSGGNMYNPAAGPPAPSGGVIPGTDA